MRTYGVVSLLAILLVACQPKPAVINHPAPAISLSYNHDVFEQAGCPADGGPCQADSPLTLLGCDAMYQPSDRLGGLQPSYPLAICEVERENLSEDDLNNSRFISYTGGLIGRYLRYVIFRDGEFHVLHTEAEFQQVFAPIESPDEALSYVLALRRYTALYGLEYDPALEYVVSSLEDSYTVAEADGYRLHLFSYDLFGCGPHWMWAVDVTVSFEGVIEEHSQEQVFKDPKDDNLCVD